MYQKIFLILPVFDTYLAAALPKLLAEDDIDGNRKEFFEAHWLQEEVMALLSEKGALL